MQVEQRRIDLGIVLPSDSADPVEAPGEIEAIEEVMGGTLEKGLDELVSAARAKCPVNNCCLSVITSDEYRHVPGGWSDHPHDDDSYTVPFTRVSVDCSRQAEGCGERAKQLTESVASMAKACIAATREAEHAEDIAAHETEAKIRAIFKTQKVTRAEQVLEEAKLRAARIRGDASVKTQEKREAIYAQTREVILAPGD